MILNEEREKKKWEEAKKKNDVLNVLEMTEISSSN